MSQMAWFPKGFSHPKMLVLPSSVPETKRVSPLMSHRGWSYSAVFLTGAMIKTALSLSISFHKISKDLVSVRPLSNLPKIGQETQVLWGATDWQAVRSHVPCVLGNHAKPQHVTALPPKCIGCIRSNPETPLSATTRQYPLSLIFNYQKSGNFRFQVSREWLFRLTVLPQTL